MKELRTYLNNALMRNQYLSESKATQNLRSKIAVQLITAVLFLIMSITNIHAKSYEMLAATLFGFIAYIVLSIVAIRTKNVKFCNYSSSIVCAAIFTAFVIVGGNDGFASLWIALLPIFMMVIMDFALGLIISLILQGFLFVVFWTPINQLLLYQYHEQFCLRFPLYFSAATLLALVTTISLQKSQYNEMVLARCDSLTGLANRRHAYEMFDKAFADASIPHSVVMCDIDHFKKVNDIYDHAFGDEVLVTVSDYITKLLPENYIKSRWGGEEFLIAANEPIDSVYEKIEVLREAINAHDFHCNGDHIKISMTFGISEYYHSADLKDAIITADNRMYIGKKIGRNCTIKQ